MPLKDQGGTNRRPPFFWRVRALALEKGLIKQTELHRLLVQNGLRMTDSQLGKLLRTKDPPKQISTAFLASVCRSFDVSLNDFIDSKRLQEALAVTPTTRPAQQAESQQRPTRAVTKDDEPPKLAGPKLRALPKLRSGRIK